MATKKEKFNPEFSTTKYALDIIAGNIPTCKKERRAAKRHIRDLKRQGTKAFPYRFDESRAERFFKFFEMCRNPNSPTKEYYKILPHQQFDFGLFFGWVKEDGYRKHSVFFRFESRGGAKTTAAAIIAEYLLIGDKVYPPGKPEHGRTIPNVRIDLIAVDKGQADELRKPIVDITAISPNLKSRIDARKTFIRGKSNGGSINILSKDTHNKLGGSPDAVIADELAAHTNAQRLIEVEQGLGKKQQSTFIKLTTAGDNEEGNIAKKEYDYAAQVLNGDIVDENYLAIIRETEPKDDVHDKKTWAKAAPMFRYLGEYNYSDSLYNKVCDEYNRAFKGNDTELQRLFKIFRLNRWQERSVKSFLSQGELDKLDSLKISKEEFDKLTHGRQKISGLDFSLRRDLTAYGEVFLLSDGRIAIDAHGFMLSECVREREIADRIPYSEWERQGWLTIMDYPIINRSIVAEELINKTEAALQEIVELCYDKYKATDIIMDLIDGKYGAGFTDNNCIAIPQLPTHLDCPTTLLKRNIIEGTLVWNGNPALRWCLANCFEFKTRIGDLIMVMKENKDSTRRIDLAAATITALARISSLKEDAWISRMSQMTEGFF